MVNIRPATLPDLPQMLEIYNDIILHTTAVYHYEPHTLDMRLEWFESRRQQGFPIFVAEEVGIILGFSTFGSFRPWPAYKYTVENSVYVAAAHRGKGISKLLMPPLIESAREMSMHTMIAVIDASNNVSIKLHEQYGFKEVALLKEVGFKFERWLDLKLMQLIL
jgi:L-amino acid N-acyltransferase YncA